MTSKPIFTHRKIPGFSIIELMIVIAIVALLVTLAFPSYQRYIKKANRSEAQKLILSYANLEEIWRSGNSSYADETGIAVPTHDLYTFYIRDSGNTCANSNPTATQYRIVACASGDQVNDKDLGVSCSTIALDQSNSRFPAECW